MAMTSKNNVNSKMKLFLYTMHRNVLYRTVHPGRSLYRTVFGSDASCVDACVGKKDEGIKCTGEDRTGKRDLI